MNKKNKNIESSPFHKAAPKGSSPLRRKGKNEGDDRENLWGRTFGGDLGKWGEDEWGIKAGKKAVDRAFGEFGDIDTETNLFAGAESKFDLSNTMEDLTVNQQQAQFQSQQNQQSQANILDAMRSGGQFNAGNIQALSNQGANQALQASASIGQQEQANKMASAQAEARNQMTEGQALMEAQKFQLQGAADARDLTLQQKQGELSFLAGQLASSEANKDSDTAGKYNSSDRRLKKNILKIGKSASGLNIYSFEYKNSTDGEGLFQGVMSDEIPQEAVTRLDGYDMVNYNMLDVEFKQI